MSKAVDKLIQSVIEAFKVYTSETGHCFNYALLDIDVPETESIGKHFEIEYDSLGEYKTREVKIDQKELTKLISVGEFMDKH